MRILCFHGRGSNSKVPEIYHGAAALRYELGPDEHEYEFVEGTIPCKADAGIKNLISDKDQCFAYFEHSLPSVRAALQDLDDYISNNGPFHALLGFSEGAILAASFLANQKKEAPARFDIRCAIFICGSPGIDCGGEGRLLNSEIDSGIIKIPTAHIIGENDPLFESGLELSRICHRHTREIVDHKGGHEVPRGAVAISEMASCISRVFDKTISI
ncbi:serine hydrolase FSH [Tricladium varicosporioides]|nr:serine hydrolase FSH [Hymenoscyphus varicosporioides]